MVQDTRCGSCWHKLQLEEQAACASLQNELSHYFILIPSEIYHLSQTLELLQCILQNPLGKLRAQFP